MVNMWGVFSFIINVLIEDDNKARNFKYYSALHVNLHQGANDRINEFVDAFCWKNNFNMWELKK